MSLEPVVIERIEAYRRRVHWNRTAIVIGVATVSLLGIALLALAIVVSATSSGSTLAGNLQDLGPLLITLLFPMLAMIAGIPSILYVFVKHDRRYFRDYFATSTDTADIELIVPVAQSFVDGLSIAAGIERPRLRIIDAEGFAGATFHDERGYGIAITSRVLKEDLTDQELEGLVAHEVAHILLWEAIECPRFWALPGVLVPIWTWIAGLAGIASFVALISQTEHGAAVTALVFIFWFFLVVIAATDIHYVRRSRATDELLADSIAAKLTSNPQALRDMLDKIWGKDLYGALAADELRLRRSEGGRPYLSILKQGAEEVRQRQANLDDIKIGRWRVAPEWE